MRTPVIRICPQCLLIIFDSFLEPPHTLQCNSLVKIQKIIHGKNLYARIIYFEAFLALTNFIKCRAKITINEWITYYFISQSLSTNRNNLLIFFHSKESQ